MSVSGEDRNQSIDAQSGAVGGGHQTSVLHRDG